MTQRPVWLTRNLVVLTLVSLFQDAASELLYPLLPLLITGVLAAPPVVLGAIEGVAEVTAGVTRYVAGRWSDRLGRKRFIGAGYGLAALGKLTVAAATGWPTVLGGRVLDRLGKGVRSAPRDALIASSVPAGFLGRAFGFHRAGDTVGAVVGPLVGLLALASMRGDLRAALWWAAVPAVMSVLLVALVREAPQPSASAAPQARSGRKGGRSPLPATFWRVVVLLAIVGVANFSDTLVLLRASELGLSTAEVVWGYILFNAVYAIGSYPAGLVVDRWQPRYVYAVGLVAFALGYAGLALASGGPTVYLCLGVYGLFPALTDGVGKAWVSRLVPADLRGRAQGVFQAGSSLAVLTAGVWAGLLWDAGAGAGTVPLLVSGVVGLASALVLVLIPDRAIRTSA